jgi:putative acyl-CoA dehydrogenase
MMCMDVRRAMIKDPRNIDALFDEVRLLTGQDARFDAMVRHTELLVREAVKNEFLARPMTEAVARVLQGAELLRHSTQEVNDIFLSTRSPGVSGAWGSHYGTLAMTVTQPVAKTVMERAMVSD